MTSSNLRSPIMRAEASYRTQKYVFLQVSVSRTTTFHIKFEIPRNTSTRVLTTPQHTLLTSKVFAEWADASLKPLSFIRILPHCSALEYIPLQMTAKNPRIDLRWLHKPSYTPKRYLQRRYIRYGQILVWF
jgi:hypothetical protein